MKTAAIVHISDLHIHGPNDPCTERIDVVRAAILTLAPAINTVILVITGDIAFSGLREQYGALKPRIDEIIHACKEESRTLYIFCAPGNHDGTFLERNYVRESVVKQLSIEQDFNRIDAATIEVCTTPQCNYFDFKKSIEIAPPIYDDKLLAVYRISVEEQVIEFWSFNTSWTSNVPEAQGSLVFPIDKYIEKIDSNQSYRIALIHHPLNWYTQSTYHPFRRFIEQYFSAVLSGHEHTPSSRQSQLLTTSQKCTFVEAGALGPHEHNILPSFSIISIDVISGECSQNHYQIENDTFIQTNEATSIFKLEKNSDGLDQIQTSFIEKLEDIGAPFSHPARDILKLSDIYIDPSLSFTNPINSVQERPKFSEVLRELEAKKKIIIYGEEHHGKTSLISRAYLWAFESGLIPIYFGAREIANSKPSTHNKILAEAIEQQYESHTAKRLLKQPSAKFVALVDDIDRLGDKSYLYESAFIFLESNFQRYIVTAGDRFEPNLLGSIKVSDYFSSLSTYKLLGFSYAMRTELIEAWYSLDRELSPAVREQKVFDAQTYIDAAVAKALLPSTAFNTLMLLQAIESTQKSQIVDPGLAQHYDVLIRNRLVDVGIPIRDIDSVYSYLSHLAWKLSQSSSKEFELYDYEKFGEEYRSKIHPINIGVTTTLLLNSRVLIEVDRCIKFKHAASLYFFLANYVQENAETDSNIKNFAINACRRLHKRDNANFVVFLASRGGAVRWVLSEVSNVLTKLLAEIRQFDFVTDTKLLNQWVPTQAKLLVEDSSHKRRLDERDREEAARREEDQALNENDADEVEQLDLFSQINLVFKTSEILGLIIKSRYGSLDATLKEELIEKIFAGPLRAMALFIDTVNRHPDALIEYISEVWKEKLPKLSLDQRRALAQKLIHTSLSLYVGALLIRQGEVAGSPDLNIYVQRIVETKTDTPMHLTYRIAALSMELSYPGRTASPKIKRLAEDLKNNPFGFSAMQGLVARHLYMFSVSPAERQALVEYAQLELKPQIAAEMMLKDKKTLPNNSYKSRNAVSLITRLSSRFRSLHAEAISRTESQKKSQEGD